MEKDKLLKYLCMALPYDVIYRRNDGSNIKLKSINIENNKLNYTDDIEERECKPYLRSMSSMTEEEKDEYYDIIFDSEIDIQLEFLLSKHFDFMGLIYDGLAIEIVDVDKDKKEIDKAFTQMMLKYN